MIDSDLDLDLPEGTTAHAQSILMQATLSYLNGIKEKEG